MDYNKIIKKSTEINESLTNTLIYDISEAIKNGYTFTTNRYSHLESILKELPEIIFIKNNHNLMLTIIDAVQVTDVILEEIVPGAYDIRFEIGYKKRVIRRISNIDSVINLKPLLEKLERFDLLIKFY
jgi:hypothetical protein